MAAEVESELWGDFSWIDSHDISDPDQSNTLTTDEAELLPLSRHIGNTLLRGSVVVALCVALGVARELHHPANQIPHLSPATEARPSTAQSSSSAVSRIGNCNVSTSWRWVIPRETTGIDDLVIHNVKGVNSETGVGSKCLRAAKSVIARWANQDKIAFNQINLDQVNPIIRDDQYYAVPEFARPIPQG